MLADPLDLFRRRLGSSRWRDLWEFSGGLSLCASLCFEFVWSTLVRSVVAVNFMNPTLRKINCVLESMYAKVHETNTQGTSQTDSATRRSIT